MRGVVKSPTRGWGHSGDLTADFAPVVGNLTSRFVKSPVTPGGGGWGMKLTSALLFVWGCSYRLFSLLLSPVNFHKLIKIKSIIKIDRVIVTQVGFCVTFPWSLSQFLSNHQKALL